MNNDNLPEPRACEDDDIPPPSYNESQVPAEVKPKPIME